MRVVEASKYVPCKCEAEIADAADISGEWLRWVVEAISYPRHYVEQREANLAAAAWIEAQFESFGYETVRQGEFNNIVTLPTGSGPAVLVGAHYDTKPNTPGADDNASAVAAMLAAAKAFAESSSPQAAMFVAFNREEEGLIGSQDFVDQFLPTAALPLCQVHVLEMVGYARHEPGSQRLPQGLPVRLVRDRADFLALLANRQSRRLVDTVLETAAAYVPDFPVLGLKIPCGLETRFQDLLRSDHAPFWQAGYPALMWTDTAEFRSPHYHQPSDTPETLDYEFLQSVARLLTAQVLR